MTQRTVDGVSLKNKADKLTGELALKRGPGLRRPDWLKNAENGHHDEDQYEFMMAMDIFKKENSIPFPTWSEILFVVKSLGYRKTAR